MPSLVVEYKGKSEKVPLYATKGSAGADLRADVEDMVVLRPGERSLIKTGVSLSLPEGFMADIRPRSGLALHYGVTLLNTPGTIDSDYQGEICVILINLGDKDFLVKKGDRIAQLVVLPVTQVFFKPVASFSLLSEERGVGGFGSTGY